MTLCKRKYVVYGTDLVVFKEAGLKDCKTLVVFKAPLVMFDFH